MPIVQEYNINTPNAVEGQVFGLSEHMYFRTVEANSASVTMGQPVKATANTVRSVDKADTSTANGICYGIIVRQVNHEAATYPSLDGVMGMKKGDVLGMMVEGQIMVKLTAAVARDAKLGFNPTNGWNTTAPYKNVVALQAGAVGDIIPVSIFQDA